MTRKAIALDAYLAGLSIRAAASVAGLSRYYVGDLVREAGIARPVGRPRKCSTVFQGSAGREA